MLAMIARLGGSASYEAIRKAIPVTRMPHTAQSKRTILSVLRDLADAGYLEQAADGRWSETENWSPWRAYYARSRERTEASS
jgi:hypothetical protein